MAKKTAPKTTVRKAAPKAVVRGKVNLDVIATQAATVVELRAALDLAVAQRNTMMADAHEAGARIVDLQHAAGFTSAGATQAAIKRATNR